MGFGDVKSECGLKALNEYLADRSYIEGYTASQADSVVFSALNSAPPSNLPHALRWYNHINALDRNALPGVKKALSAYGPAGDAKEAEESKEEDDIDLFGSDEDDDAEAVRQERLKAYEEKKSKKPVIIAKSNIILDVKPWDDETDMAKLEECVRQVQTDGLVWGASKLVPVGYGIKKLQIMCVVEDDKVGTDFLEEEITKNEDLVQSVDIVAFNKV